MRRRAFADTSAWLPVLLAREERHADAVRTYAGLIKRRTQLVTTNLVVAELHALMVRSRGAEAGVEMLDRLYSDPSHDVRFVDRDLEAAAVDRWLRVFKGQRLSLADAVSFEVMRREGIRAAFALDRHFAVAGYELLL